MALRTVASMLGAAGVAWVLFGGLLPVVGAAVATGVVTAGALRARRRHGATTGREAWPDLLDEVRVRAGAGGLPLPAALFLAGRSAADPLGPACADAERIWNLTTDFDRSLQALTARAPDPTTALVCTALGSLWPGAGTDLAERLDRLAGDRRRDADAHREAEARGAGARFARRFVLLVPLGLALVGQAIGTGRDAYRGGTGQVAVLVAVLVTLACWVWSGRLLATDPPAWTPGR